MSSASVPDRLMALALLTQMSMPPKRSAARSTAAKTCASSRMSPTMGSAWPPASSIAAAAVWIVPSSLGCGSAVLAISATLAPSRAARSAMASPMPRLAPEMKSVLSASGLSMPGSSPLAALPDVLAALRAVVEPVRRAEMEREPVGDRLAVQEGGHVGLRERIEGPAADVVHVSGVVEHGGGQALGRRAPQVAIEPRERVVGGDRGAVPAARPGDAELGEVQVRGRAQRDL